MYIPSQVRIGSVKYDVIVSSDILTLNGRECKGLIDYEFHTININNSIQDRQGVELTLLHELVHGIIKERSLSLEGSDEESIVEEISRGLHQVIKDNSVMFKED